MVKIKLDVSPWTVPNFIRVVRDGEEIAIPLNDVDDETLERQADRWLDNLFAAAGKGNPFMLARDA